MKSLELDPTLLWKRYLLALGLVAGFLVASHTIGLSALSGGEEASLAINVSGRQRMLSQRILALSAREEADPTEQSVTVALDEAIALFARSHAALTQGGDLDLSERGAVSRRPIYQGGGDGITLNQQVEAFLQDLAIMRGRAAGDSRAARNRLQDLERTDRFLGALDGAVKGLEKQAVDDVVQLRRLSHLSLLAALLVLLIEARLIFWPAHQAVARSIDELKVALKGTDDAKREINRMLNARTSFFATMSGDLQTPLKILRGYVEQVLKVDLPQQAERQLGLVHRAAEQMERIVDDVLDVRRIEEGLMVIEEEPVELSAFIDDLTGAYRPRAERKGVRMLTDIDPNLPEWVDMDPRRLGQIVDNLLSNAVKFTFEGKITLRMAMAAGGQWILEVTDSGEGLSPADQAILFTRFEQKPGEPGRCEGGTGLGLPICYDLAKLMGGELTVESELNRGSTFRVTLPLKAAQVAGEPSENAVEAA